MPQFTMSIASVAVEVTALFPATQELCKDYLSNDPAAFSVSLRQEDIEQEYEILMQRCRPEDAEILALLRKVADRMLNYDTVLFHSVAVAVNGKAYLFTAPSGTGKSTHARLWQGQIPGAYILNGDKPFLRVKGSLITACGSPWRGKEMYGINECLPLEAICIVERDTVNHIEPISCETALGTLIRQAYRPEDPALLMKSIQLIGRVGQSVRLYQLGCNMDPEAAIVSSTAMILK